MGDLKDMQFTLYVKNTDFIVRDYNLFKVRVMPSITFIDIIYRFLISKNYGATDIELKNLVFKNPISTSEGVDVKLQLSIKVGKESFELSARSQQMGKGSKPVSNWEDNFQCSIHMVGEGNEKGPINIGLLVSNPKRKIEIDDVYDKLKENEMTHHDFMSGKGNLFINDEFWLGQVDLSELANQYVEYFYLHPAYLNAPIVLLNYFAKTKNKSINKPFVPAYIESFRVYDNIKKNSFIYMETEKIKYNDEDVINANIEMYDSSGHINVVFKGVSLQTIEEKSIVGYHDDKEEIIPEDYNPNYLNEYAKNVDTIKELIVLDLKKIVSTIIKKAEKNIPENESFFKLGLDSRLILELGYRLSTRMGKKVNPTILFGHTNIGELTGYVDKFLRDVYENEFRKLNKKERLPEPPKTKEPDVVPVSLEERNKDALIRAQMQLAAQEQEKIAKPYLTQESLDDVITEQVLGDRFDIINDLKQEMKIESSNEDLQNSNIQYEQENSQEFNQEYEVNSETQYIEENDQLFSDQFTNGEEVQYDPEFIDQYQQENELEGNEENNQQENSQYNNLHNYTESDTEEVSEDNSLEYFGDDLKDAFEDDSLLENLFMEPISEQATDEFNLQVEEYNYERENSQNSMLEGEFDFENLSKSEPEKLSFENVEEFAELGSEMESTESIEFVNTQNVGDFSFDTGDDTPVKSYAQTEFNVESIARELLGELYDQGEETEEIEPDVTPDPGPFSPKMNFEKDNFVELVEQLEEKLEAETQPVIQASVRPEFAELSGVDLPLADRIAKELMIILSNIVKNKYPDMDMTNWDYSDKLESNILMDFVSKIDQRTSLKLSPSALFRYKTISLLAMYITKEYGEKFSFIDPNQPIPEPIVVAVEQEIPVLEEVIVEKDTSVLEGLELEDLDLDNCSFVPQTNLFEKEAKAVEIPSDDYIFGNYKTNRGTEFDIFSLITPSSGSSFFAMSEQEDEKAEPEEELIFVLSAKDQVTIIDYAIHLRAFIREILTKDEHDINEVKSMIYALQQKPERQERVAFKVESFEDMFIKLRKFISGKEMEGIFKGSVPHALISSSYDITSSSSIEEIAQVWVNGGTIDFKKLRRSKNNIEIMELPEIIFGIPEDENMEDEEVVLTKSVNIENKWDEKLRNVSLNNVSLNDVSLSDVSLDDVSIDGISFEAATVQIVNQIEIDEMTVELAAKEEVKVEVKEEAKVRDSFDGYIINDEKYVSFTNYFKGIFDTAQSSKNIKYNGMKDINWGQAIKVENNGLVNTAFLDEDGELKYFIYSDLEEDVKNVHLKGTLLEKVTLNEYMLDLDEIKSRLKEYSGNVYDEIKKINMNIGEKIQSIESLEQGNREVLVKIKVSEDIRDESSVKTFIIESAIQSLYLCFAGEEINQNQIFTPYLCREVAFSDKSVTHDIYVYGKEVLRMKKEGIIRFSATILDTNGDVLAKIKDFTVKISPKEAWLEKTILKVDESTITGEVDDVKERNGNLNEQAGIIEPIAIIGMSGVMPSSEDIYNFYEHVLTAKTMIQEVPQNRLDLMDGSSLAYKDVVDNSRVTKGGYLNDIESFDAAFFGIKGEEAKYIDPQQRLLLQTVWNAVEDAGYKMGTLSKSRIGVFVGSMSSEYSSLVMNSQATVVPEMFTGINQFYLSNRISKAFDFKGPSEVINTGYTSSISAMKRAVDELQKGTCEVAIAGASNLLLSFENTSLMDKMGLISRKGNCAPFDMNADGYVRSEGIGVVLLKPLSKAIKNGDNIYAVIRGISVGHGGAASSLTSSESNNQSDVIFSAWDMANLNPMAAGYLELSAQGVPTEDKSEINAIKSAYEKLGQKYGLSEFGNNKIQLGTVKSYSGNLESASGIIGLFNIIMSLKYGKRPGVLNLKEFNSDINLKETPFELGSETTAWNNIIERESNQKLPRLAGLNSVGMGGVSGHVVIEEFMDPNAVEEKRSEQLYPHMFVFSSKNEDRLRDFVKKFLDFVKYENNAKTLSLDDVAYTLQIGREPMDERLTVITESMDGLVTYLSGYLEGKVDSNGIFAGNIKANKTKFVPIFDGEEADAFVRLLMENKNFKNLAQLWILGIEFDWKQLHVGKKVKRVSLPGYQFKGEKFWFSYNKTKNAEPVVGNNYHAKITDLLAGN